MLFWVSFVLLLILCDGQQWSSEIQAWVQPGNPYCNAKTEWSDGRKIHVIKAEYFTIDASGQVSTIVENSAALATTCNGWSSTNEQSIKQYSLEQYATVSGGGTNFLTTIASASLRSSTVATLTNWIVSHGFTGLEVSFAAYGDWMASDYSNYKTFLTAMGQSLHANGKKLMVVGPAIADAANQGWFTFRYEDFNNLPVDFVVVSAYNYMYDYSCMYPNAPTTWVGKVIDWAKSKITNTTRIVVALPSNGFYGVTSSYNPNVKTTNDIRARSGSNTATVSSDSYEKTWTNGGTNTINYFCDSACMNSKRTFIESKGITRVSVYHLGGNDWFTGKSEIYPTVPTSVQTSAQTSAQSSAQTSEATSAQTSAQSSEQSSAQTSEQTSAQTSAEISAESSAVVTSQSAVQSSAQIIPTSQNPSSQAVSMTSAFSQEPSQMTNDDVESSIDAQSDDDNKFYKQIWFIAAASGAGALILISIIVLAVFVRRRGRKFNNEKLDVSRLDMPFSVPPPLPPPFDAQSEDPDSLSAAMPSTPERIRHSLAHAGLMPIPPSISSSYHVEV